jgi:REP element-mobilizing transposase RayT
MPDHPRGYTQRKKGYLPTDPEMARNYERRANDDPSEFDDETSTSLVQELIESCPKIKARLHAGATEITHIHALVSWKHDRSWMSMRASLKTSLTKALKRLQNGTALSRGGSRKRVEDRDHFDHLMKKYLSDHSGVAWYEDRGWVCGRRGK